MHVVEMIAGLRRLAGVFNGLTACTEAADLLEAYFMREDGVAGKYDDDEWFSYLTSGGPKPKSFDKSAKKTPRVVDTDEELARQDSPGARAATSPPASSSEDQEEWLSRGYRPTDRRR